MVRPKTRDRIVRYLEGSGPIEDSAGSATETLRRAVEYDGSKAGFTQLLAAMVRDGQLERKIRGKRTYRIGLSSVSGSDRSVIADVPAGVVPIDYDRLADALLLQVVQNLTDADHARGGKRDGSWTVRRLERLERQASDSERALARARAETRSISEERDALLKQVEIMEANSALVRPNYGRAENRSSGIDHLDADERLLLHQLRGTSNEHRPGRAS